MAETAQSISQTFTNAAPSLSRWHEARLRVQDAEGSEAEQRDHLSRRGLR